MSREEPRLLALGCLLAIMLLGKELGRAVAASSVRPSARPPPRAGAGRRAPLSRAGAASGAVLLGGGPLGPGSLGLEEARRRPWAGVCCSRRSCASPPPPACLLLLLPQSGAFECQARCWGRWEAPAAASLPHEAGASAPWPRWGWLAVRGLCCKTDRAGQGEGAGGRRGGSAPVKGRALKGPLSAAAAHSPARAHPLSPTSLWPPQRFCLPGESATSVWPPAGVLEGFFHPKTPQLPPPLVSLGPKIWQTS